MSFAINHLQKSVAVGLAAKYKLNETRENKLETLVALEDLEHGNQIEVELEGLSSERCYPECSMMN